MVEEHGSQEENLLFPQRQGDMAALEIKGQDKEEEEKEERREYEK